MVIDVHKTSSSDYPTKLTSTVSLPSGRDHQHNSNQTIPTTITKDQAIDIPPGFFDTSDDTATTTATNQCNPTILTITTNRQLRVATIIENQEDFYEMTLEEQMQQYDDEQYAVEDRAEEAVRPKSECEILAAAMDSSLFELPVNSNVNTTAKKKQQKRAPPTKTTPSTNTKSCPPKTRTPTNTKNTNKKKKKKAIPPKTRTPPKTTYEIKRPIVKVEEVKRYLQHVQNNPDLDPTTTAKGLDFNSTVAPDMARALLTIVELLEEETVEYV